MHVLNTYALTKYHNLFSLLETILLLTFDQVFFSLFCQIQEIQPSSLNNTTNHLPCLNVLKNTIVKPKNYNT